MGLLVSYLWLFPSWSCLAAAFWVSGGAERAALCRVTPALCLCFLERFVCWVASPCQE